MTIADQCALKRTTEVAREFIAGWCGPPHDYLMAAKALGLEIPAKMLAIADEVIE